MVVAIALGIADPRAYAGVDEVQVPPSATDTVARTAVPTSPPASEPPKPTETSARDWRLDDPPATATPRRVQSVAPEEQVPRGLPREEPSTGPALGPVGAPGRGRMPVLSWDSRPPTPEATREELVRWLERRQKLRSTVGVFGGLTAAGLLLMVVPVIAAAGQNEDDGHGPIFVVIAGAPILAIGAAGTVLSAPFLAHHVRWDRPTDLARQPPSAAAHQARRRGRQLRIALWAEAGAVVLGAVSVGLGFIAANACADNRDLACTSPRLVAGGAPGFSLIGLGALAMVSTGILFGQLHRHGHLRGSGPWLTQVGPTSVRLRF